MCVRSRRSRANPSFRGASVGCVAASRVEVVPGPLDLVGAAVLSGSVAGVLVVLVLV